MNRNIGIIGCGSVVQSMYVFSIPAWKNIGSVFLFDIDKTQAEKVADILKANISTLENLVERSDIIIIASPPHTHFDLLKMCMQKGKTVICEKPFLLNINQAKEILAFAESNGTQLFVAHIRRILPAIALGKQIIKSRVLGEIKSIDLFEGGRFSYRTQSSYETKNPLGGVLTDTGSHTLDAALFVTGLDETEIDIKNIQIQRDKPEPAHEMKANFILESDKKNIPVSLFLSRKQSLANKINIVAENGIIEIPVGLQNSVRIHKQGKEAFLSQAPYEISNYHQAMALEYDTMFDETRNDIFKVNRFMNLTLILQKLLEA